jgi:hypothetical protein
VRGDSRCQGADPPHRSSGTLPPVGEKRVRHVTILVLPACRVGNDESYREISASLQRVPWPVRSMA